jgi:hypothetical protein
MTYVNENDLIIDILIEFEIIKILQLEKLGFYLSAKKKDLRETKIKKLEIASAQSMIIIPYKYL